MNLVNIAINPLKVGMQFYMEILMQNLRHKSFIAVTRSISQSKYWICLILHADSNPIANIMLWKLSKRKSTNPILYLKTCNQWTKFNDTMTANNLITDHMDIMRPIFDVSNGEIYTALAIFQESINWLSCVWQRVNLQK